MLRRANSKSSNRLSRRKSASSVHTKQDSIDPDLARRQAQAAATCAFARAYERASCEIRLSGEDSCKSEMIGQRRAVDHSDQIDQPDQRGRGVRRQQSVRFTGPDAVPKRRSIGTKVSQTTLEERDVTSLRPRALTNNVPVPAVYRPPSRSSSIGKSSVGKGTAQNIVTALAAYDEYYTREDEIASTPSSYRRMRRSKSTRTLSSPSKAEKLPSSELMTSNDYNTRIQNRVRGIPSQGQDAALRAPKSMSFLRGGRQHMSSAVREDHDAAVQMARDTFLHQIEQQRLREQPSFLFRARARREEKPFRHSVRSGSSNSYGLPVASANQIKQPNEGSLRTKVRKASRTIKNKLKELFGRGSDQATEAKIPDQQVEARLSHGSSNYASVSKDEFEGIPHPDKATVSRVTSRLPSLHSISSNQRLKSRNGSVSSLRSDGSEKMPVTSWADTADGFTTNRYVQAEREAQRLSIIQENGTHVASTSFARMGVSNQFSAYPLINSARSVHRRGGTFADPVDSQKVYSALMKRLDENSPMAKLEARRIISGETFAPVNCIPPRSSSVGSRHSSRGTRTPATIRHVRDDPEDWKDRIQSYNSTAASLPHEDDDVFSPKPSFDSSALLESGNAWSSSNLQQKITSQDPPYTAYPILSASEGGVIPPQQQAARNESITKPPKPPRNTTSIFFGNSSFVVNRSPSPYRRALAEADHNYIVKAGDSGFESSPNRILFAPPVVHCSDPKEVTNGDMAASDEGYTESMYSRTTSGRVPAAESSQSLSILQDDFPFINSGAATVGSQRTYQPTGPTRNGKPSSQASKGKARMTSAAIIVDKPKEANGMVSINYALPSMPNHLGHFREHAQISGEDTDISQRKVSVQKQPVGILQQTTSQAVQLKPILKHKSSISLDGFPMPPPPPPPLPPPVPPMRYPLRPTQSKASLRSLDATSTHQSLSAPSSSIKQQPQNNHRLQRPNSLSNINRADTPAKLIKRNRRPSNNHDPSPGIGAAVDRQFGSVGSRTPYSGTENLSPADATRNERYGSNSIGHKETKDAEAQVMGSRVMVDMFLSSRRRKVAGSDESSAFL